MGKVYIVDDEEAIREGLKWLLESRGIQGETFGSGEECLAACHPGWGGCLLLDVRMPGMTGLELFARLKEKGCNLPAIFLTGHGDVPMAVEAMRMGAADFLEKPFSDNQLVDRVTLCLEQDRDRQREQTTADAAKARLDALTAREFEVMRLILAGKLNKNIADELAITMRTVEVHRSRVLEKMGVHSAVELAQFLAAHGLQNRI